MSLDFTIGLVVEGLGSSTSKTGGVAFSWGELPSGTTDYEWLGGMQQPPGSIEDRANLFTGEYSTSAFSFDVARSDLAAQLLLYQNPKPDYALGTDITASATTVAIEDLTGTAVTTLAGEVIYIRDEAILLGTHAGTGSYTGCTRGMWSTSAAAQDADTFMYRYNPYLPNRQVLLVFYDRAAGTESIRWRGYLENAQTTSNGVTIQVRAVGLMSKLQGAELNRDPRQINLSRPFTYQTGGRVRLFAEGTYIPRLHKTGSAVGTIPTQAGDTLTLGTHTGTDTFTIDETALEDIGAPAFPFDEEDATDIGGTERVAYLESVQEVWYTDARFSTGSKRGGPSSVDLFYPLHPIHLAMGFMTSTGSQTPSTSTTTFDAFGEQMAAGLPLSWFDTTSIAELVADEPDLEIDRLGPLGWDGQKVNLFDLTNDVLLRPYGYQWAVANDGLITIMRLQGIDIGEFCASSSNALDIIVDDDGNRLEWEIATSGSFNAVTASVGELPWREPDRVTINSRDGQRDDTQRSALFRSSSELAFDLRTYAPQADDADVIARLMNFAVLGYKSLPTIGVIVRDSSLTGVEYDIGSVVSLNAPAITKSWFIDRDRNIVDIDADNEAFVGKIVGRRHIFDQRASVYELDLLLPQWASGVVARWRAPALEVVSASGATITVTQNAFHADSDDTSFFEKGDRLEAWYTDGVRIASTNVEIQSVTATTITTDVDISASLSGGEILRLANLDTYGVGGSHLDCSLRVFAFYADADEELGTAGDPADVYG